MVLKASLRTRTRINITANLTHVLYTPYRYRETFDCYIGLNVTWQTDHRTLQSTHVIYLYYNIYIYIYIYMHYVSISLNIHHIVCTLINWVCFYYRPTDFRAVSMVILDNLDRCRYSRVRLVFIYIGFYICVQHVLFDVIVISSLSGL